MTQESTNRRVIRINGEVHVAGECCQLYICKWCGNRGEHSSIGHDLEATIVCETCDKDKFWDHVNGAKVK